MWLLFYLLFGLLIIFFVSGKVLDKIHSIQIELDDYNTLLICESCGKLHRKYQEELEKFLSPNYKVHTCPRCHQPSAIYNDEQFKWLKSHPDFPKLNIWDLRKYKKTLKKIHELSYQDKTIEKFLSYHQLLPKPVDQESVDDRGHGKDSN